MNLLHIVNSLEIGGLEKVVVDLTRKLSQINHTVVCLTARGALSGEIMGECLCLENRPGLVFSTIPKLKELIYQKSIDIVHTHNQGPQFYGSIAGKLAGRPVIHTKHGQNPNKSNRRYYLDKFSSFLTNIVVTVSEDTRDICTHQLKIPEKKLVTVLNGIDTDRFYRFDDKKAYVPTKPFIIGVVARLSPEKNHACLLDACKILVEKNINFQLKIVGDGPLRNVLEDQSRKYGIQNQVFFEGARMDIPVVMNEFDLFVLPSLTEGVSLTLLEAMACELPVVATAVGGNPEVVVDGTTGVLVPSNDPARLVEAIISCMDDPQQCVKMGQAGRSRVVSTFSLTGVAEKYLMLYQSLLPVSTERAG